MLQATSFTFNGVSSDDYDVMIYYLDTPGTEEDTLWTSDVEEERLNTRVDSLFYGLKTNKEKTITMTFGSEHYLEREEVEQIADWLTSHNTYKWLEIDQDDLSDVRFKVIMSNLQTISLRGLPFAFRCEVMFDSQLAHSLPTTVSYEISDGQIIKKNNTTLTTPTATTKIENPSTFYGYIYPKVSIEITGGTELRLNNNTDGTRPLVITKPESFTTDDDSANYKVIIDSKNQIITCNCTAINPYQYFGDVVAGTHYFPRLTRGTNMLQFTGSGKVTIEYEPMRKVVI